MEYNTKGLEVKVPGEVLRFVTILDPHFSPVTPSSRKDDFFQSTADAFGQAVRFAVKMECQALLIAGDIFHLKTGSRNPHWFMKAVIGLFKSAKKQGVEVIGIAGNHDLTFGSLVSLESQPIGVLAEADAIHLLDDKSILYRTDTFTARVAGCSYHHAQASFVRDLKKDGADFLVSTGHFWFGKETGEFFGEPVYGPSYFDGSESDAFVIGHHHADQGIQSVNGKQFFAHGSMNRVGAHAGDLERKPAVGLLEITKAGITGRVARLKVQDAKEIFDVDKHVTMVAEKKELDNFMALISSQVIGDADVASILGELELAPAVRARVDQYITAAETEESK